MSDLGDFTGGFDEDEDGESGDTASATTSEDGSTDVDEPSELEESTTATPDRSFEPYETPAIGSDEGIGVLSAGRGLQVSEDPRETELMAYITAANRSAVRIGSYLLAPYPDGERLFCRISGLTYAQEYRADDATEIHAFQTDL